MDVFTCDGLRIGAYMKHRDAIIVVTRCRGPSEPAAREL